MEVYSVIGQFDTLGFPTGYHAKLVYDDSETTLCGLPLAQGRVYRVEPNSIDCHRCLSALSELATIDEVPGGPAAD